MKSATANFTVMVIVVTLKQLQLEVNLLKQMNWSYFYNFDEVRIYISKKLIFDMNSKVCFQKERLIVDISYWYSKSSWLFCQMSQECYALEQSSKRNNK